MDLSFDDDPYAYERMRRAAEEQWQDRCATMSQRVSQVAVDYANSPDARMRPDPGTPWSYPGILCSDCQGTTFYVPRWTIVNGTKTLADLVCVTCSIERTWNWGTASWNPDVPSQQRANTSIRASRKETP